MHPSGFLSWLIHSGLTIPFYSKYSLYFFAFILGTMLMILEKKDLDEILSDERLTGTKNKQRKK